MFDIDFFHLFDWLNRKDTPGTQSTEPLSDEKQCSMQPTQTFREVSYTKHSNTESTTSLNEVSGETDVLKRFVVYEEGKENPYYDVTDICERVYEVLHLFYSERSSGQRGSISVLVDAIKLHSNSRIGRHVGWTYIEKFVKEFIEVSI